MIKIKSLHYILLIFIERLSYVQFNHDDLDVFFLNNFSRYFRIKI